MDIAAPGDNPAPPPRQASLKVLLGLSGANRVWHLPPIHKSASGGGGRCKGCVVFFVGDQLEGGVSQEVLRAQEPRAQAAAMSEKWPHFDILVVMPSRLEAGAACFDHFLNRTTRTGEPLGYQGHSLRASRQLWSLLGAAGLLSPDWHEEASLSRAELAARASSAGQLFPDIIVVGFSKGGVVLNQLLAEASHCCGLPAAAAAAASKQSVDTFDWVNPPPREGIHFHSPRSAHPDRSCSPDPASTSPDGLCGGRPIVEQPPDPVEPTAFLGLFLGSVRELHYCDAGLHCRGAFMTDPRTVEELKGMSGNLKVVIHGSPRQLKDPTRPWVSAEAESCVRLLQNAGLQAEIIRYFEGEPLSLEMHFNTIKAMRAGFCAGTS